MATETDYSPEIFISGSITSPRVITIPGIIPSDRSQNFFPTFYRGEDIPILITDPGVNETLLLTVKGHDWNMDPLYQVVLVRSGVGDLTATIPANLTQNWNDNLYFFDVFIIQNAIGQPAHTRLAAGSFSLQNSVDSNNVYDTTNEIANNPLGLLDLTMNETPTGAVDGVNAIFTTSAAFLPGQINVYLNGVRQELGVDFTVLTGPQFQMTIPPFVGDIILVDYVRAT